METKLDCFVAISEQGYKEGEALSADIGDEAIDRDGDDTGYTDVNIGNPCNVNGEITSIEIWALTNLVGCKVASFYIVSRSGNNAYLATRDYVVIGAVTAGSKQTFPVNLLIRKGDYIGYWADSGDIEYSYADNAGVWSVQNDSIPCSNKLFTYYVGDAISVKGTGIEITPKTFANIDGTLLVDDNGSTSAGGIDFYGVRIPCELDVRRDIIGTYFNVGQGIRIAITVNGEPVEDSLIGDITIAHNLNYISTFSFTLGNPKYSPLTLTGANIVVNSVVIITIYVNGQAFILFTGLIDETRTTYDGGYRLQINGRDYGKKLLDKTMTLISVQESADKSYRGSMVKYLAGQADITNVNVPTGDKVTIDHSFQDQTIWDMIQKECAIEGWYVQHDENAIMKLQIRKIKSNKTSYPVADWEYGEDKFIQLGLETSDIGIINKVIILGAIFEEETITVNPVVPVEVVKPPVLYDETSTTFNKSFTVGEVVTNWSEGDATLKVITEYIGYTKPLGYLFPVSQNYKFKIIGSMSGKIKSLEFSVSGGATKAGQSSNYVLVARGIGYEYPPLSATEKAFSISITVKTKDRASGGIEELEEENPEETFTSTITYTQVKATVTDNISISVYGERKPNNEGTLEFPLAETEAQCKRIGENIILDSHRFIKQPDFEIPFNPKLIVGQTVELTDKKIGYDEDRYFVEEVIHTIGADSEGKMKARTRIGCVYYA